MEVRIESLVGFEVFIDVDPKLLIDFSITEVSLIESLMSPSIQTKLHIQNYRHPGYVKDLDKFANAKVKVNAERPILKEFGFEDAIEIENNIYRIGNRIPASYQVDEFLISAIDETAMTNASKRVSKSWKCTPPHSIVSDVLKGCVKAPHIFVESSTPPRTFFAENIYPYQVVAQQADVALANGNDPSFLHFMTYENIVGTHRFESLYKMTRKSPIFINQSEGYSFVYKERGNIHDVWEDPHAILSYEFPCDFDLLSDLMNGSDTNGIDQNSLMVVNPFNGIHSILGGSNSGCGMGGQKIDQSFTNKISAFAEPNCEIDVEKHRLKRQARLGLLDQDKVALRMTVAFNPILHVGKMITVEFKNKIINEQGVELQQEYASGQYLISALTHNLKIGGYSTTVIDCLSKSVGNQGATLG